MKRRAGFLDDPEPEHDTKKRPTPASGYCRCEEPFVDDDSEGEGFCWKCGRPLSEGDE